MAVRDVSLGLLPPVCVAWTRRRLRDPTIIQSSLLCFPLPLSGAVSGLLYVQGTLAYRLPRPSGLMYQCSRYTGRNLIIALTINWKRSYFQCLIMKLIGTGPITSNPPPSGSTPPQRISIAPRSCLSSSSTWFLELLYTACTQCKVLHLVLVLRRTLWLSQLLAFPSRLASGCHIGPLVASDESSGC